MGLNRWRLDGDRHEDRDSPIGFDSSGERPSLSPPDVPAGSLAPLVVAEGAIATYADVTGET